MWREISVTKFEKLYDNLIIIIVTIANDETIKGYTCTCIRRDGFVQHY